MPFLKNTFTIQHIISGYFDIFWDIEIYHIYIYLYIFIEYVCPFTIRKGESCFCLRGIQMIHDSMMIQDMCTAHFGPLIPPMESQLTTATARSATPGMAW